MVKGDNKMPIKHYSKTGAFCRVTFHLPGGVEAKKVSLCGDFNEWNPENIPMKKRKDGRWSITVSLKAGDDYRYKYLLDGENWENDWNAEKYLPNSYGTEDSVIKV
jgi:1,4-alpha-glucan branching enzyme